MPHAIYFIPFNFMLQLEFFGYKICRSTFHCHHHNHFPLGLFAGKMGEQFGKGAPEVFLVQFVWLAGSRFSKSNLQGGNEGL